MSSLKDSPLVGSCHKFSDGYGYGQRYLTSRNQPTLPCSVPIERHPPPTDRFLRVTSPTKLIGEGNRADRRNADQILMQTSGEVGRFYIDPDSQGVKLGRKPLQPSRDSMSSQFNLGLSQPEPPRRSEQMLQASGRNSISSSRTREDVSLPSSRLSTARSDINHNSNPNNKNNKNNNNNNHNNSSNFPSSRLGSEQYLSTLRKLDSSFNNINRRDLFAASMPSRPAHELVWCAAGNNIGAQATKGWAEQLRHKHTS